MNLRSPLARAKGMGASKNGLHHWWLQRVSAVALIPLGLWFMSSLLLMVNSDHASIVIWLQTPSTAVFMLLLIIALFYHLVLGLQVVIEDYIESKVQKLVCLLLVNGLACVGGLTAALSLLKIFFS